MRNTHVSLSIFSFILGTGKKTKKKDAPESISNT
jgi:hypothetical protein